MKDVMERGAELFWKYCRQQHMVVLSITVSVIGDLGFPEYGDTAREFEFSRPVRLTLNLK